MFNKGNNAIPLAIIVAGVLIAGSLYFALSQNGGTAAPAAHNQPDTTPTTPISGVQKGDHIIGNPDAKVVIVEFSDPECPFCKEHHKTLNQVVKEYAPSDVAWVYRDFPLPQLHPKAPKEAEALECAAKLGGNDAFWKYTNRLYEITPSNNGLDLAELPKIARYAGLDVKKFNTCLSSGEMAKEVKKDTDEAWASGGRGTPHNVILHNGEQTAIPGMMRFSDMKALLDKMLAQ